eukprot:gene5963-12034_t
MNIFKQFSKSIPITFRSTCSTGYSRMGRFAPPINNLLRINRLCSLTKAEFHILADQLINDIQDRLSVIEEQLEECDVNSGAGVLNINLGPSGHWVINKQSPNSQIWWSSPVSGPLRFEYKDGAWRSTRDSSLLIDRLRSEFKELTGIDIML